MSAAIWSSPSAFGQPSFGPIGKYDFGKFSDNSIVEKFKSLGMPSFVGTVTDPGKVGRDINLTSGISGEPAKYDTKDATPSIEDIVKANVRYQSEMLPIEYQRQLSQAGLTRQLNVATMSDLYPFLSAAGAETTARNLAASQAYRRFSEGLPSNVQNIMASKQAQATSAATAEAERQRATAAQQQAATDFARIYSRSV